MNPIKLTHDDKDLIAECKARPTQVVDDISKGVFILKPNGHCGWCEVKRDRPAMRQEEIELDSVA